MERIGITSGTVIKPLATKETYVAMAFLGEFDDLR
jgi:hypothetical protein